MEQTYPEFMAHLSPCSSRGTAVSCCSGTPRSFRPEEFDNLFAQRNNELSKYGTLTDSFSAADVKLGPSDPESADECSVVSAESCGSTGDDSDITLNIILSDSSTVHISINDIKNFLMNYLHVPEIDTEVISAVHLLVYLYSQFPCEYIGQLGLYHMGKSLCIASQADMCTKKSLIKDLHVDKYPCFHFRVNSDVECRVRLTLSEMVYMSFALPPIDHHYSVTYAEAIYHKIKSLKKKRTKKQRFHALKSLLRI